MKRLEELISKLPEIPRRIVIKVDVLKTNPFLTGAQRIA